jgi:hypothetical protein
MRASLVLACCAAAGCSNLLGIENLSGPGPSDAAIDAAPGGDAATGDAAVPGSLNIKGMVRLRDLPTGADTPYATLIDLVRFDGSLAQTTMSDQAAGRYSMTVQTGGAALDVAVRFHGNQNGFPDLYQYFPAPLTDNRDVGTTGMVSFSSLQTLASAAGVPYSPNATMVILVQIHDTAGQPVAGARLISDQPSALIRYSSQGLPSNALITTSADGIAYVFDQKAENMMLSTSGAVVVSPRTTRGVNGAVLEIELRGARTP